MESSYLKALGEKQTPVTVKLHSGETFRGWIEYYDVGMVRLTREGSPNLFIFKERIAYISEDTRKVSGQRREQRPQSSVPRFADNDFSQE